MLEIKTAEQVRNEMQAEVNKKHDEKIKRQMSLIIDLIEKHKVEGKCTLKENIEPEIKDSLIRLGYKVVVIGERHTLSRRTETIISWLKITSTS